MRTFTRVANMSPGLRDTGDEIDAAHINVLQESVEDLQTGALPIALAGIEGALGAWADTPEGGGRFNAAHYGASPSATDNIPFINAAIEACYAAGGGTVYVPTHKVYPILPSGTSNRILLRSGVHLDLGDARLQVAADSPSYQCVATAYGGPSSYIENSGIIGGEIDQNPANHAAADAITDGLYAWLSWNGERLSFRGTSYISGGVNTIQATSSSRWIADISDCVFEFIQAPSSTPNYDNSALYIAGYMTRVTGNRFYSTFDDQARGAIEIHGPHAIVTGNETHRYWTLANLTPKDSIAWYTDKPYAGHIVSDNVVYEGRKGITIWVATGKTYKQASIVNNIINIAQKTGDFVNWHGIAWFIGSGQSGVSEDIQIKDNLIRFEAGDTRTTTADGTPISYSTCSAIHTASAGVLRNGIVSGNTIVDNPLTGMRIGTSLFSGSEHDNVLIERNLFVNSGCNRSWHRDQRSVFFLAGKFTRSCFRDNTVIVTDADGTFGDQRLTYLAGTPTSGGSNEFVDNRVQVNGGYTLAEATDTSLFAYRRPTAATTLGTVTKKQEVFDQFGASLGFIPIYDAIT